MSNDHHCHLGFGLSVWSNDSEKINRHQARVFDIVTA